MFLFGQCLCGYFTLIQQGGLAGSSLHLGTKKEAGHLARPLKCVLSLVSSTQGAFHHCFYWFFLKGANFNHGFHHTFSTSEGFLCIYAAHHSPHSCRSSSLLPPPKLEPTRFHLAGSVPRQSSCNRPRCTNQTACGSSTQSSFGCMFPHRLRLVRVFFSGLAC